jgi:protein CpxP
MSKVTMLTLAVVGLLAVNLGLIAFLVLRKPGPPPHERQDGPRNVIIEKLGLTEAQTARYDQLITEHQAEIRRLNDEIRKTKNNLYATLASDSESREDFFISRLGALQRQVETAHYTHFMALKNLCTPDQKDKFNDLTTSLADYFAIGKRPPMGR